MKKRLLLLLALLMALALPPAAPAEDGRVERLEKELEGLRSENAQIRKRLDTVELDAEESRHVLGSFSRFVEVSGYADAEFYLTGQEGENDHFRVRHLSLFFIKDIQKEWKLFTEIEYEDAPLIESTHVSDSAGTVQGKLFVEQMYIEYHPTLAWDLRFGRFLTPAGIWNIYHYPPYVPTQSRPLVVRRMFPFVSDGVQLRNYFPLGDSVIDTHLYLANGAGNPGRLDRNEQKAVGARVNMERGAHSAGASFYRERDNSGFVRSAYGVHFLWNQAPFKLQAEYQYRFNDPDSGLDFQDKGLYAQLSYDLGKWTLAARYDWYDPLASDPSADIFRYTGALNYHFAHNVIGKAEYGRNDFEDGTRDYSEVIFAIVVAIGDL